MIVSKQALQVKQIVLKDIEELCISSISLVRLIMADVISDNCSPRLHCLHNSWKILHIIIVGMVIFSSILYVVWYTLPTLSIASSRAIFCEKYASILSKAASVFFGLSGWLRYEPFASGLQEPRLSRGFQPVFLVELRAPALWKRNVFCLIALCLMINIQMEKNLISKKYFRQMWKKFIFYCKHITILLYIIIVIYILELRYEKL